MLLRFLMMGSCPSLNSKQPMMVSASLHATLFSVPQLQTSLPIVSHQCTNKNSIKLAKLYGNPSFHTICFLTWDPTNSSQVIFGTTNQMKSMDRLAVENIPRPQIPTPGASNDATPVSHPDIPKLEEVWFTSFFKIKPSRFRSVTSPDSTYCTAQPRLSEARLPWQSVFLDLRSHKGHVVWLDG